MKPKLLVTRLLPPVAMEILQGYFDLEVNPHDRVLSREELIEGVGGKQGLLCLLTDVIDAEIMDVNPDLRVLSNYAVGYNNIDIDAATERGIPVCNTPGVLTETTADLTWALILACVRRIPEGDRFVREGRFKSWGPMHFLGFDLHEKTLGIVGLGRIGQAVLRRAHGFGMRVVYTARSAKAECEQQYDAKRVELEELLEVSDIVSVHVPLNEHTQHLLGMSQFEQMKEDAIVINTARGPIIDEAALVQALRDRSIAGAGLDVYEQEPKLSPGLTELDNVVLLPHIGSATIETRTKMGVLAAKNAIAVFEGEQPYSVVNPQVL